MAKLTLFVGGSVGSDPYSPRTWSGTCVHLVTALEEHGILERAIGVALPRAKQVSIQAVNFHPDRSIWRSQYYFDPSYRHALTSAAASVSVNGGPLLQIGHMFSLPKAFPGKHCISYHDGNLAEKLKSGFGLNGVPQRRIDQAIQFEIDAANQMTAIFTFSEYLRQSFISDYGVVPDRVFNVGGGINLTDIPEEDLEKDYSTPSVLFIGIEFGRKGGPQLLEAFRCVRARIPDAQLHIVGPENLQVTTPGVTLHGRLSKSDPKQKRTLNALFRKSSLFVLPSLYEPFGIAPLEAMLHQLPCLVTDAWALREMVRPGINGDLVAKGDSEELAFKMIHLLSAPEMLSAMGTRGRELVFQNYTWQVVTKRIAENLALMAPHFRQQSDIFSTDASCNVCSHS